MAGGVGILLFLGGGTWMTGNYLGWSVWQSQRLGFSLSLGIALIAVGWWPERVAVRVAFAAVGAAAAMYALACVTGGWLGTAPWQLREVDALRWIREHPMEISPQLLDETPSTVVVRDASRFWLTTLILGLSGLALIAVAVWPRWVWVERPVKADAAA